MCSDGLILMDPHHGAEHPVSLVLTSSLSLSHRLFMSDTSRFTDTVYLSGINVFFVKSGQKQGVILFVTNS